MRNLFKGRFILIAIVGIFMMLAACTNDANTKGNTNNGNNNENNANENEKESSGEKVTIQVAMPLNEEYFEGRFGGVREKLKDKNIDIEWVPYGGSTESLEELFSKKINPDIIIGGYGPIKDLEIGYPLDDLIEQHDFDINSIDPSLLSFMQSLDDEGKIVGFPDGASFFSLYYNKEVFDKLGKDYPDPDVPMTWKELMELTKEMTQKVGDEQYIGLDGGPGASLGERAPRATDPETGEVLVEQEPAYKMYLELMEEYYNIPGIDNTDPEQSAFVELQTAAMTIASNNYFSWGWGNPDPSEIEHIDMAPIPVWEDQPETTPAKDAWPMVIANYSEHKDEAFEVLMAYLDPEIQIGMAKNMSVQTPLINPEVLEHYGSEVPTYEGKNIDAYFFGEAALYEGQQSNWDAYIDLGEAERKLKEDKLDVVTVLRELAEEADSAIKQAMAEE